MAYPHYVYCTCSLARLASPTCSRVRVHVPVVHIRCRATVEDRYLYEGTVQLRQFTLIRVVQYSTCTVHVRVQCTRTVEQYLRSYTFVRRYSIFESNALYTTVRVHVLSCFTFVRKYESTVQRTVQRCTKVRKYFRTKVLSKVRKYFRK